MIHDNTAKQHWSEDVDDWVIEFEDGDVVLSPGRANFQSMIVVSEIDLEAPHEHVVRRAAFWEKREAEIYAAALDHGLMDVHELVDDDETVYIFAFPEDAPSPQVQRLAGALEESFDDANILFAAADVTSDLVISKLDPEDIESFVPEEDDG